MMKHLQKLDWKSDLSYLSYGYWKCMFVDFLTTYINSPHYVHTIECKVIYCADAPGIKKTNVCSKVFVECIILFW
jgi:hypothetical protein